MPTLLGTSPNPRVNMLCWRCSQRAVRALTSGLRGHVQAGAVVTEPLLSIKWYSELKDNDGRFEKENILTIPNVLSAGRIALSPAIGYLVLEGRYSFALGLFALTGVSDVLDGYIARKFKGQSSMLGSVLDPLADKVLMSVLCLSLTAVDLLPVFLTAVILGRDVLLIGASFYLRYRTLPYPRTWSRYWDIQRSTVQVTPNTLGKVNTALQLMSVGLSLCGAVVGITDHPLLTALWLVTGATTVSSAVSYLYKMKGFKILKKPP